MHTPFSALFTQYSLSPTLTSPHSFFFYTLHYHNYIFDPSDNGKLTYEKLLHLYTHFFTLHYQNNFIYRYRQPTFSFNNYYINFNLIIYGPPASGKYTQAINIIKPLSPSLLKYHNKIVFQNDKICFSFPISDIHYEIDISLLGCNSKVVFFELLLHIIDVISVNPLKFGIILCKNFDSIHSEFLETFYSYMQKFNINTPNINIIYILITESISFIPNNIVNACNLVYVPKPNLKLYTNDLIEKLRDSSMQNIGENIIYREQSNGVINKTSDLSNFASTSFSQNSFSPERRVGENVNFSTLHSGKFIFGSSDASAKNVNLPSQATANWSSSTLRTEESLNSYIYSYIDKYSLSDTIPLTRNILFSPFFSKKYCNEITNLKEVYNLVLLYLNSCTEYLIDSSGLTLEENQNHLANEGKCSSSTLHYEKYFKFNQDEFLKKLPKKIFNIVCDNIIREIINYKNISMARFREAIYDILTYNLNVYDCVWYIINYFVENSNFIGSPFLSDVSFNFTSTSFPQNWSSSTIRSEEDFFLLKEDILKWEQKYYGELPIEVYNKILLTDTQITDIIKKTYIFFKHYNNNYRPIYHLEYIFYYMVTVIHNFSE